MKILLIMLLASTAAAEPPWLEEQTYGTTAVEVKRGTITINSMPPVSIAVGSTVTAITEGSFLLVSTDISVVSGSGSSVFSATGTIKNCSFVPPSSSSIYDFEIVTNDSDEFPVFGNVRRLVGKTGLIGDRILLGSHKARFENASPDGTYKARCVVKK